MEQTIPQAFPGVEMHIENGTGNEKPVPYTGMALRDYFAAKAMEGAINHHGFPQRGDGVPDAAVKDAFASLAQGAYLAADAMLAERSR